MWILFKGHLTASVLVFALGLAFCIPSQHALAGSSNSKNKNKEESPSRPKRRPAGGRLAWEEGSEKTEDLAISTFLQDIKELKGDAPRKEAISRFLHFIKAKKKRKTVQELLNSFPNRKGWRLIRIFCNYRQTFLDTDLVISLMKEVAEKEKESKSFIRFMYSINACLGRQSNLSVLENFINHLKKYPTNRYGVINK